jgi:transcriptional regulator with XRE-family HTH domain
MPARTRATPATATIEVNGFAVRVIRTLMGIEVLEVARLIDADRSYIYHLEHGRRVRMSVSKFEALRKALGVDDRRALMASPHAAASNGNGGTT